MPTSIEKHRAFNLTDPAEEHRHQRAGEGPSFFQVATATGNVLRPPATTTTTRNQQQQEAHADADADPNAAPTEAAPHSASIGAPSRTTTAPLSEKSQESNPNRIDLTLETPPVPIQVSTGARRRGRRGGRGAGADARQGAGGGLTPAMTVRRAVSSRASPGLLGEASRSSRGSNSSLGGGASSSSGGSDIRGVGSYSSGKKGGSGRKHRRL